MIIINASISTASAASPDEIIALCTEHSVRSRAEPGCISHGIHVDCEDPSRLFFYEEWQDDAAVAVHFAVAESGEFVKRLTALVGERPKIRIYRADPVSMAGLS